MILNLKALHHGRSVVEQDVVMTDEQVRDGALEGAVSCRAAVDTLQFQIHAAVSFSCSVRLVCSRCLREFSQVLSGDYRVVIQNEHAPRNEEGGGDEVDFFFSDDDSEVDTRRALYDEIMISVPLMPLCSPRCEGIEAGGPKPHPAAQGEVIDPRWEALKKLKSTGN